MERSFRPQPYNNALGQTKVFHVDVEINNKSIRALTDTGASFSLISADVAGQLNISKSKILPSTEHALDASGTSMTFVGQTQLVFKIGKADVSGTFHIWQNRTHDMILGQDFLQKVFPITFTEDKLIFSYGIPKRTFKAPLRISFTPYLQHKMHLAEDKVVRVPGLRIPHAWRAEVKEQVQQLIDRGVVERSLSPYLTPLVAVRKT